MPDLRVPELTAALDRAVRAAGFDDYMPAAMIGHFVRQVTPSSLEGNRFLLNQFYQWVRQEYSIPDSAFGRAFNQFGPEAARMGVTAVEPPGFDPGFGETIRSWLIGTVDGDSEQVAAASLAPHIPIAETPALVEVLPVDYELPMEPVQYGVPADEPEVVFGQPVTDETAAGAEPVEAAAEVAPEEIPAPIDDSAIVADTDEALPALRIDEPAAPVPAAYSPQEELQALRAQVAEELRRELWPAVYEEVRSLVAGEVRPALEAEVRDRLTAELRPELERTLTSNMRDELYARVREEVTGELRASEHAPIASEVRDRIEESVREELRRELWNEVREEVKEDMRTVMGPAIEGEVRREAGVPASGIELETTDDLPTDVPPPAAADAADQRGLGLGADDQLLIIRRLRERLAPALREQFARELTDLAASLRQKESEQERERRLSDPEYCREQVRLYFFPDQPALWERVKPMVDPARWRELVRGLSRGDYNRDRLARSRPVVREALILKAEIESEMGSAPPRGVTRPRALAEALAGADRALDFALDSLSETINGI